MASKTFTCVNCPMGCTLEVAFDDAGAIASITGNTCKRGEEYARQEAVDPRRNVSALVMVPGCLEPLSVKTAAPVPKARIMDVMAAVREMRVESPIAVGQVLLEDVAGTGVAIVATKDMGC